MAIEQSSDARVFPFKAVAIIVFVCFTRRSNLRPVDITGLGKRVGSRVRVSRLLAPSGRRWRVHATWAHSFAQP